MMPLPSSRCSPFLANCISEMVNVINRVGYVIGSDLADALTTDFVSRARWVQPVR